MAGTSVEIPLLGEQHFFWKDISALNKHIYCDLSSPFSLIRRRFSRNAQGNVGVRSVKAPARPPGVVLVRVFFEDFGARWLATKAERVSFTRRVCGVPEAGQ